MLHLWKNISEAATEPSKDQKNLKMDTKLSYFSKRVNNFLFQPLANIFAF